MKIQSNNKYLVYKAENNINGNSYIGVTTDSIRSRIEDHLEKAKNNVSGKFYEALRLFKPESFS